MAVVPASSPERRAPARIHLIDTLRGVALLAMATYHFCWDLEFFGYLDPGTASHGLLKLYARSIASTFLFLAGVSLVLGHGSGIRWRSFFKRFAIVVAAAAAISVATTFATPDEMIFFGILHCMAAASLIGLVFLRLPAFLTAICAVLAFVAPIYLSSDLFDKPWLFWVGLSQELPRSNDYVPILPWLAPYLLGMTAMRTMRSAGMIRILETSQVKANLFTWAGRNSLAFYLVHQPVLIAVAYSLSVVIPPEKPDPVVTYRKTCEQACVVDRDQGFCQRFCGCTLDKLMEQSLFAPLQSGAIHIDNDERIQKIASQCTAVAQ